MGVSHPLLATDTMFRAIFLLSLFACGAWATCNDDEIECFDQYSSSSYCQQMFYLSPNDASVNCTNFCMGQCGVGSGRSAIAWAVTQSAEKINTSVMLDTIWMVALCLWNASQPKPLTTTHTP